MGQSLTSSALVLVWAQVSALGTQNSSGAGKWPVAWLVCSLWVRGKGRQCLNYQSVRVAAGTGHVVLGL